MEAIVGIKRQNTSYLLEKSCSFDQLHRYADEPVRLLLHAMVHLTRRVTFNAAHKLYVEAWSDEKNREVFGKCANTNWHGHNYQLFVTVKGNPDPMTGFVMDAKKLGDLIKEEVSEVLDHSNLNLDIPWLQGKQPTSENIAIAIWGRLSPKLDSVALHCVRLVETENISVDYYGE